MSFNSTFLKALLTGFSKLLQSICKSFQQASSSFVEMLNATSISSLSMLNIYQELIKLWTALLKLSKPAFSSRVLKISLKNGVLSVALFK